MSVIESPLTTRMVEPAQDCGETFRHSFGDDVGIHRPQLPANCCPDVGSERGRGFALVVIVHPEDICRACRNKLIETCTSSALQGQ